MRGHVFCCCCVTAGRVTLICKTILHHVVVSTPWRLTAPSRNCWASWALSILHIAMDIAGGMPTRSPQTARYSSHDGACFISAGTKRLGKPTGTDGISLTLADVIAGDIKRFPPNDRQQRTRVWRHGRRDSAPSHRLGEHRFSETIVKTPKTDQGRSQDSGNLGQTSIDSSAAGQCICKVVPGKGGGGQLATWVAAASLAIPFPIRSGRLSLHKLLGSAQHLSPTRPHRR